MYIVTQKCNLIESSGHSPLPEMIYNSSKIIQSYRVTLGLNKIKALWNRHIIKG